MKEKIKDIRIKIEVKWYKFLVDKTIEFGTWVLKTERRILRYLASITYQNLEKLRG